MFTKRRSPLSVRCLSMSISMKLIDAGNRGRRWIKDLLNNRSIQVLKLKIVPLKDQFLVQSSLHSGFGLTFFWKMVPFWLWLYSFKKDLNHVEDWSNKWGFKILVPENK